MLRFLFFAAGVMTASTSSAGGISACPPDTVPIQIVGVIRSGPKTTLSTARFSESAPHFRAFVTAVTQHVADRIGRDKICLDSADSKKRSLLQFVNWPLSTSGDKPLFPVQPLDERASNGCRISSPWIDLAFERRPVPWIRGVVRWNERQFLADQAVLASARNVPRGLAIPTTHSEYTRYWLDYARSEITGGGPRAAAPIEERLPPDILWLFRRSTQSTLAPFGEFTRISMEKVMETSAERHTKLVTSLIDRCLASDGADVVYSSILEAADLISLQNYKIETPIR